MDNLVPLLGIRRPDLPPGVVPALEDYCISPHTGFLGDVPDIHLPLYYHEWERIATNVPKYLLDKTLRKEIDQMPLLDYKLLKTDGEKQLAFLCLCFMGNGYVWQEGDGAVPKKIPAQLAIPWCALAELFGCNPVICYLAFFLKNWKLRDPLAPISAENLEQICEWPNESACRWFLVVSLLSEIEAVPGLKAVVECQKSVARADVDVVQDSLETLALSIEKMTAIVKRLKEGIAPHEFYNDIRPYMGGWGGEGNALPSGLIYEGVSDEPRKVMGGSNAQMSAYAVFDAALGMSHRGDGKGYLDKALYYMPRAHRDFIIAVDKGPSVRNFVMSHSEEHPLLRKAYNRCVEELVRFRSIHIQIVTSYVLIPSKKSATSDVYQGLVKQGTGGTALIPFLRGLRDTTKEGVIFELE